MMYKHFLLKTAAVTLLLLNGALTSAQVTIGANKEAQSFSVLEIEGNGLRGLRLPQIQDTIQRDIVFTNAEGFKDNPLAMGLQIFNMKTRCVETWNGTGWIKQCAPPDCVMINGVCWATRNVNTFGTFVDYETDYGMFYQFNRPTAWNCDNLDEYSDVIGYDVSMPTGTEWEAANDPCPDGWRVPTHAELLNLLDINNVTNEWTTLNGINGIRFTDKISGNYIFLPAAGVISGTSSCYNLAGEEGYYWSSTDFYCVVVDDNCGCNYGECAYRLTFYDDGGYVEASHAANRRMGRSVRCVKE